MPTEVASSTRAGLSPTASVPVRIPSEPYGVQLTDENLPDHAGNGGVTWSGNAYGGQGGYFGGNGGDAKSGNTGNANGGDVINSGGFISNGAFSSTSTSVTSLSAPTDSLLFIDKAGNGGISKSGNAVGGNGA